MHLVGALEVLRCGTTASLSAVSQSWLADFYKLRKATSSASSSSPPLCAAVFFRFTCRRVRCEGGRSRLKPVEVELWGWADGESGWGTKEAEMDGLGTLWMEE